MRFLKKSLVFLFAAALVAAVPGPAAGQGIYLDHVDGLYSDGTIPDGAMLTFHMRVVGDATAHLMLNNGFVFSSPELIWSWFTGEFNPAYPSEVWFDFVRVMNFWGGGPPQDTVLVGLLALFGPGLPVNFDGDLYSFTLGPIQGPPGAILKLDSSWCPPSNPWMWDVVGPYVDWGGPYEFMMETCCMPLTYCEPQPTILKDIESILRVHIMYENTANVDLNSIRVQSKIPPYEGYPIIEGGEIITACFVMRFLGSSGFRPITADFEATYTVDYSYLDGTPAPQLVGDFSLQVYPGDVTFDGKCDMNDVIFMADYFWGGGNVCYFGEYEVSEFMDIDGSGKIDPVDVLQALRLAGF